MANDDLSPESEIYFLRRILLSKFEKEWESKLTELEKRHAKTLQELQTDLRATMDMLSEQFLKSIETLESRVNNLEANSAVESSDLREELEQVKRLSSSHMAKLREEISDIRSSTASQLSHHRRSIQQEVSRTTLETQLIIEESKKEQANTLGKPQMAEIFSELAQKLSLNKQ